MTRAGAAALGGVCLLALVAPACLGPGDFRCTTYTACGAGAFCEADGHCSLPDPSCASSRRRYVHAAGAESDACVAASCAGNPVVQITAGGSHACVLRSDGGITCWGRNDDGQLGDGTLTPRSLGVRVHGIASAIAVAAGARHSCAVLSGGTIACWGADDTGQLGDGSGPDRLAPAAVAGISGAIGLAAGDGFSCALLSDQTVACWGDDSNGAVGDGAAGAMPRPPTPVAGLTAVTALAAHWEHACAIRADGTLWCWGENASGQLGDGSLTARPQPVQVPGLTAVAAVATGLSHSCAAAAGGLYCWGSDSLGQLGDGSQAGSTTPVTAPTLVPIVTDPIAVDAGAQHTCAIRSDGQVLCWGQNSTGQLGEGSMSSLAEPVPVTGLDSGARIATGSTYSCAEATDQAVYCWGDNHYGQLGTGNDVFEPRPVAVPGAFEPGLVAAGGAHTCAASPGASTDDPSVVSCWGSDQAGQLGDNDTIDRSTPAKIEVPLAASAIAGGGLHTCATDAATGLWCWGRGSSGQLGLGPSRLIDTPLPAGVPLPAGAAIWLAVVAGDAHTCASAAAAPGAGGQVFCFGDNSHGELGDGTLTSRATPAPIVLASGGVVLSSKLAAGGAHSCAIDTGGDLWCWGRNDHGQLGIGTSVDEPTPTRIDVGVGLAAVTAGETHTCALAVSGGLYCWGADDRGQLGLGVPGDDVHAPAAIGVTAPVANVAAGGDHTCVTFADRSVACWGANENGQLGDGTATDRASAARIAGATGPVVTGAAHSCAAGASGALVCWGADTSGQLGDGVELTVSAPEIARLSCN